MDDFAQAYLFLESVAPRLRESVPSPNHRATQFKLYRLLKEIALSIETNNPHFAHTTERPLTFPAPQDLPIPLQAPSTQGRVATRSDASGSGEGTQTTPVKATKTSRRNAMKSPEVQNRVAQILRTINDGPVPGVTSIPQRDVSVAPGEPLQDRVNAILASVENGRAPFDALVPGHHVQLESRLQVETAVLSQAFQGLTYSDEQWDTMFPKEPPLITPLESYIFDVADDYAGGDWRRRRTRRSGREERGRRQVKRFHWFSPKRKTRGSQPRRRPATSTGDHSAQITIDEDEVHVWGVEEEEVWGLGRANKDGGERSILSLMEAS
ncbi:hypothetical protein GGX14DRAFT_408547 [Mycena pura]|uniref:Uncharacterized protein n=1 Tax=Mycena pura TaxID=153505 RepID=A0AAD6UMN9_9AGAR|nr:hypothetical protein GGX14DRAFT_408540 [Mycena pura]KAJ7189794.1 hypothetical protein GGX14DRAFT_408547 [Mycena pura]